MSRLNRRNTYHLVPEPVTGYILNPADGYLSVIVPELGRNLANNPSVEINDFGYFTLLGAGILRTSTMARRGLFSMMVTPVANMNSGIQYVGSTIAAGNILCISVDVWAYPGVQLALSANIGASPSLILTKITGKGRWERIYGKIPTTAGVPNVQIRKRDSHSLLPFYIDGLQIELNDYPTTYIDGDQIGYKSNLLDYYWTGIVHNSVSVRTANCRSGGRIVPLKDLGLEVTSIVGLGMSGISNDIMNFGTLDGGEYHDTYVPPRQFTVTGAIFGKNQGDLQKKRKSIIDTIKPDIVIPKQPVVLRYEYGNQCEKEGLVLDIPCVYSEGMAGQFDNHHQERVALSFIEPWPYILEDGSDSKALDDLDLTNSKTWAFRDTGGLWHNYGDATSGGGAASIFDIIQSRYYGGLFLAGDFDLFGGNACDNLVFFNLSDHTVTEYTPWADDPIYVLHEKPDGTIFMGGAFHNIGINGRLHLAYMDITGTDFDLAGGADDVVYAINTTENGDVYIGGDFANVGTGGGAIVAAYLAMYDISAATWANITPGGDPNGRVSKILVGMDGKVYIGGGFSTVNGVTHNHVAVYDPIAATWDTLGDGLTGGNVLDLCFGPDGRLYAVGTFTTPCGFIAVFNGANWEQVGSGIKTTITGTTIINKICLGPDNKLYFAGDFAVPGPFMQYDCEYAMWDGSCLTYLACQPPVQIGVEACDGLDICLTNAGEIALSFDYSTATPGERFYGAQPQTITNTGSAIAHPTLVCEITGGSFDNLYIENLTTGDVLRMALKMPDMGRLVIDMTPGNLRSWTNYPVKAEQMPFDGSDLATFKLAPGANRILVWGNRDWIGATAAIGMYWRNNYWSSDSGVL